MNIKNLIQSVTESAKVNFAGHKFLLKVDTNEDPQKKGVKVQFIPTQFGALSPTEQNDIAIELEARLEQGLGRDVIDTKKTVMSKWIHLLKLLEESNRVKNKLNGK